MPPFREGRRTPTPEQMKKPELPHLCDLSQGHSGTGPVALGPFPWTLRLCSDHVRKAPLPFLASQGEGHSMTTHQPRERRDVGGRRAAGLPPERLQLTWAHLGPRHTAPPPGTRRHTSWAPNGQRAPCLVTPRTVLLGTVHPRVSQLLWGTGWGTGQGRVRTGPRGPWRAGAGEDRPPGTPAGRLHRCWRGRSPASALMSTWQRRCAAGVLTRQLPSACHFVHSRS